MNRRAWGGQTPCAGRGQQASSYGGQPGWWGSEARGWGPETWRGSQLRVTLHLTQ